MIARRWAPLQSLSQMMVSVSQMVSASLQHMDALRISIWHLSLFANIGSTLLGCPPDHSLCIRLIIVYARTLCALESSD